MTKTYPLAKLGNGHATHSLMPNGKTHCWKNWKKDPYPTDNVKPLTDFDISGGVAEEIPLMGLPTCHWCLKVLGLVS